MTAPKLATKPKRPVPPPGGGSVGVRERTATRLVRWRVRLLLFSLAEITIAQLLVLVFLPYDARLFSVGIVCVGAVYLGAPESGTITGPPYTAYIVANSKRYGISVRLKAEVIPNEATGQLTTIVDEPPEQPFSNLTLHFDRNNLTSIANPLECGGGATGSAKFVPYANPGSLTFQYSNPALDKMLEDGRAENDAAKRKKIYDELVGEGMPIECLQRVHAPIGLDIGGVSPEEIAISIVAELIAVRRGRIEEPHVAAASLQWKKLPASLTSKP